MANKKFSEFTLKTDSANVDFLVGYDGTDNVRIAPDNLGGGGGASDLNGLSDVTIENTNENAYFIDIPASRSGDLGNLGLGVDALENLTGGDYNLAIGANALNTLTTSQNATAVGYNAGAAAGTNLMGDTTLIGNNAGFGRSGYRTVAVGSGAMGFGSGKTAVNRNTAIGYHALYRIDTNGADNIAIGHEASQFLTTATQNIAIGDNAARSSTADSHISIGYQAGYSQTSGIRNTNIGYRAGYTNTIGSGNAFLGYEAGYLSTGGNNTFLGYKAGDATTTGANNIIIGSGVDASSATVSNEITLGNSSISALRCQVQTISALSDSRDKTNIQPSPYGLDLISQLQPVTFDWNMRDGAKVGQKDLGFIAQELQEVDDENLQLVYDSNPDRLEASYGRLIPVLVQAIKELKAEVELLKNK